MDKNNDDEMTPGLSLQAKASFFVLACVLAKRFYVATRRQRRQELPRGGISPYDAVRQRVISTFVVSLVLLPYHLGIVVAIRTTLVLGVVTTLVCLNGVYLAIYGLRSARVVDEDFGEQLILLVEGMDLVGDLVSLHPDPTGPSLQTVVLALTRCVCTMLCPRIEGRGEHDTVSYMV